MFACVYLLTLGATLRRRSVGTTLERESATVAQLGKVTVNLLVEDTARLESTVSKTIKAS